MADGLDDQDAAESREAPLPWHALDMPVAVPATLPVADLLVIDRRQARIGPPGAPSSWVTVDVGPAAFGTGDQHHPDWTLVTRARRGVRPTGPPGVDALELDTDISTIAADAVHRRLSLDIPPRLSAADRQRQIDQCWETSQQMREAFTVLHSGRSPWQRTVITVDGHHFAWWVYHDGGGWAAAADLGVVMVSAFGTGAAPSWSLTLLPAGVAAHALPVRS